jgi:hypothetical protein
MPCKSMAETPVRRVLILYRPEPHFEWLARLLEQRTRRVMRKPGRNQGTLTATRWRWPSTPRQRPTTYCPVGTMPVNSDQ